MPQKIKKEKRKEIRITNPDEKLYKAIIEDSNKNNQTIAGQAELILLKHYKII